MSTKTLNPCIVKLVGLTDEDTGNLKNEGIYNERKFMALSKEKLTTILLASNEIKEKAKQKEEKITYGANYGAVQRRSIKSSNSRGIDSSEFSYLYDSDDDDDGSFQDEYNNNDGKHSSSPMALSRRVAPMADIVSPKLRRAILVARYLCRGKIITEDTNIIEIVRYLSYVDEDNHLDLVCYDKRSKKRLSILETAVEIQALETQADHLNSMSLSAMPPKSPESSKSSKSPKSKQGQDKKKEKNAMLLEDSIKDSSRRPLQKGRSSRPPLMPSGKSMMNSSRRFVKTVHHQQQELMIKGQSVRHNSHRLVQKIVPAKPFDTSDDKISDHDKENNICADCAGPKPTWVIFPWGGYVCTKCSGVHRSLGVHISFVQSLELDKLNEKQEQILRDRGNRILNEELEYYVPEDFPKPFPKEKRNERERYIRAKYNQEFTEDHAPTDKNGDKVMQSPCAKAGHRIGEETSADIIDDDDDDDEIDVGLVEYSGMLRVELKSGTNLCPADLNGSSDPYVVLETGTQKIKSKTIRANLNPKWNETLMICWETGNTVSFHVYDHDIVTDDDFMGHAIIDVFGLPQYLTPLRIHLKGKNEGLTKIPWKDCVLKHDDEDSREMSTSRRVAKIAAKARVCDCFRKCLDSLNPKVTGYIDVEIEFVKIDH